MSRADAKLDRALEEIARSAAGAAMDGVRNQNLLSGLSLREKMMLQQKLWQSIKEILTASVDRSQ